LDRTISYQKNFKNNKMNPPPIICLTQVRMQSDKDSHLVHRKVREHMLIGWQIIKGEHSYLIMQLKIKCRIVLNNQAMIVKTQNKRLTYMEEVGLQTQI